MASFVIGNYAPHVPAFAGIANLSWFHWTYDHVALVGMFDWASLGLVTIVTVVLSLLASSCSRAVTSGS